jgi:hypothetical protein
LPTDYRIAFQDGWEQEMATSIAKILSDPDAALSDQSQFAIWITGDIDRYEAEVDRWVAAVIDRM